MSGQGLKVVAGRRDKDEVQEALFLRGGGFSGWGLSAVQGSRDKEEVREAC